jgi:alpha-glucosidase
MENQAELLNNKSNITDMKKLILLSLMVLTTGAISYSKNYKISSPDGNLSVTVNVGKEIIWSAFYNTSEIISSNRIAMTLKNGSAFGSDSPVRRSYNGSVNDVIRPVVAYKRSVIPDVYNYLTIVFKDSFNLDFRVYNDGIAYRFETWLKDSLTIKDETAEISLPPASVSWFPYEQGFMSHNENTFTFTSLDTIAKRHLASLPTLFRVGTVNVLLTEAGIEDYPGMWLRGAGPDMLYGTWPAYPAEERLNGDRNLRVTKREDYIARTSGTRTFPWRVFVVAPEDGNLVESDIVFRLASPDRLKETDWIKPGKVAWDWWNANNIYGVDFRAGLNTETYKYYIDFASKNGIEYVILDEGWYKLGNVLDVTPGIDIEELCRYAESKNVGIILWVVWKSLDDRMDKAFDQFREWGVKGVKVDFMQRDDQKMVNFYYKATQKAADHKMLIDFHGSYKPDGFGRTYPNALTREGVKGMENDKWSTDVSPEHDVTIPFTRMVAGPMDYTPGAMVNMDRANFRPLFTRPESQGTRVHQMALYVVFESPLQMLADSPSNLMKEQECTDFIVKVPVVWDDIKVISASVGNYLLLARRSGRDWFVGGLTDWDARDLELDLSFLKDGEYLMDIFQDGINADRYASDYKHLQMEIRPDLKMKIHLAPGGGWVARISPR